jgi:integrase
MFGLAAYCGLRAGEILGLSVEDVNLENAVLTITKTAWQGNLQTAKSQGSETTVPMPAALCQLLKPLMPKSGLLFVNKAGRPYASTKIVERRLWPVSDSLGIPRAGFHAFRHTHTTVLLESGATPKITQRQLRHADPTVTLNHYAHVIDSSHREAVEKAATLLVPSGPKNPKWTQAS